MYTSLEGLERGVEEERSISQNKKKTANLHLKARMCHVLLVKDGRAGLR